jgi:tetratricopeptide (TPR) repeat protein
VGLISHHTFPAARWPRQVGTVPRLAACFQDRATLLEPTASVHVVSGLGGVGKSQLAAELAHRLWRCRRLDLLVWISATSREAILAGYAHAAADLALAGTAETDTDWDAARFLAWLAGTRCHWLVVLDDLASGADLQGLWPPSGAGGWTVVTTQLRDSALEGTGHRRVELGVFSPAEAAGYLRHRLAGQAGLIDDANGVAADLGFLPLALSQAAAFMADEQVTCTDYRRRFADRRHQLDDLVPDRHELPDDYRRTVAATLSLSIGAANQRRPAGLATPLLLLASVLDPAGIPTELFNTGPARHWLPSGTGVETVRAGLRCLHRLNLLTEHRNMVSVHSLVQRATRDQLTDDELRAVTRVAADALVEIWPDGPCAVDRAQPLRANATAAYHHGAEGLLAPVMHPLLARVIWSLGDGGNLAAAVAASEQLVADLRPVLGLDHPDTLTARVTTAYWLGRSGDPAGAVTACEALLQHLPSDFGDDHPVVLEARFYLARFRGEAGDYHRAVAELEQILDLERRTKSRDDPDVLMIRHNIARLQGLGGDPTGAVTELEDILSHRLRVQGPDHPYTLSTRHNLARFRGEAGDPAAAATAFAELLLDRTRVLGPDHPETLATRHYLAQFHGEAGDPTAAATALERLLTDQLATIGPDHPNTLITRRALNRWQSHIRR